MIRFKYIIIFVLVLILIVILLKRKQIKEKFNSNSYYLNNPNRIEKKPQNIGDISLVLFYREGCSITREFLYGCCQDFKVDKVTETVNGIEITGNENKESGYDISPAPTEVNISKNENYVSGTKCPPLKFFNNKSTGINTCIQEGESTFSKLKNALENLNEEFKKYGTSDIQNINYLNDLNYSENDKTNLFNLKINIYLIQQKIVNTEFPFLPLLRLYIPHKLKEGGAGEYTYPYLLDNYEYLNPIDYDKNINNLCQIFHFLYTNITFSINTGSKKIILFENTITKREGEYGTVPSEAKDTENLIRTFLIKGGNYTQYCDSKPILNFIHEDEERMNNDIIIKRSDPNKSYIESRPKMFWDNINPLGEDGIEIEYLLIILKHKDLKEYYSEYKQNENLIYWMGWGIPVEDTNIPFKDRKDLSEIPEKNFGEVYPYMLFKEDSIQTYTDDMIAMENSKKIDDIIKNIPLPFDLTVNIIAEIYGITKDDKMYFDQLYKKYHNQNNNKFFNIQAFYNEFLRKIPQPNPPNPKHIGIKYLVKDTENKELLQNYFKQNFKRDTSVPGLEYTPLPEKHLRVFSYNNIFIELEKGRNRVITLPSKIYYEIHFKDNDSKVVHINNTIIYFKDKIYRIPFRTDKFSIRVNIDTKIVIKESKLITKQLIWSNLVSNNNYTQNNLDSIAVQGVNSIKISFSRPSRVEILFHSDLGNDLRFRSEDKEIEYEDIVYGNNPAGSDQDLSSPEISETVGQIPNTNTYYIDSKVSISNIIIDNITEGTILTNGTITFYDEPLLFKLKDSENKDIKLSNKTYWHIKKIVKNAEDYDIYLNDSKIEYYQNSIYRIPFKTDSFELYVKSNTAKPLKTSAEIEINESDYITQPLLWTTYLPEEKYDINDENSVKLNENINSLEINLAYEAEYILIYKKNEEIIEENNNGNISNVIEITSLQDNDILYNGIISIKVSNNEDDFSKNRITDKNLEFKNCIDEFTGHQILPTISVDNLGIEDINDYYFGLEIFYFDKEGIKKPVYLEWDIDPGLDETLINYKTFKYRCNKYEHRVINSDILKFTNNSLNYYYNDRKIMAPPVPTPTPTDTNMEDEPYFPSPTPCDLKLEPCKEKKIKISTETGNLPKNIRIKVPGKKDSKLNNLFNNKYDFTKNKLRYELRLEDSIVIELIYNLDLKIWQLWHVRLIETDYNEDTNIYTWIANQKNGDYIFNIDGSSWILSPSYNDEISTSYDFFSYPNWFRKNTKISHKSLEKTKEIKLSFNIMDSYSSLKEMYIYDCNESNINSNNIKCTSDYKDVLYFRNTFFNIPNISESVTEGTLNPKKIIVRHLEKEDEFMMDSESDTNLYYGLDLRAQIHLYNKKNRKNLHETANGKYIFNLLKEDEDKVTDLNFVNRYERILSELVKKNYINEEFYNSLISALEDKKLNECEELIEKISNELLIQKGDLNKNSILNNNNVMNKNDLNNFKLNYHKIGGKTPISKHIIDDKKQIDTILYEVFLKYINENKIHTKNYTSYGPIQLNQYETLLRYRFPINIKCLEKIENNIEKVKDNELKLKLEINLFYSNTGNIRKLFNKLNNYLSKYFTTSLVKYTELDYQSVKTILSRPFNIKDDYLSDFNPQHVINMGIDLQTAYQYLLNNALYDKFFEIYNVKAILDNIMYLMDLDIGTVSKIDISRIDNYEEKINSVDPNKDTGKINYLDVFRELNIINFIYNLVRKFLIRHQIKNEDNMTPIQEREKEKEINILKDINTKFLRINNKLNTELRFVEILNQKFDITSGHAQASGPSPSFVEEIIPESTTTSQDTTNETTTEDVINHYKKMIFQIFSDGKE